jgi:hypothetical protein
LGDYDAMSAQPIGDLCRPDTMPGHLRDCIVHRLHFGLGSTWTGWRRDRVNRFRFEATSIIERNLELGAISILRKDDYNAVYNIESPLTQMRKDSKYSVLFRAFLDRIPHYIAEKDSGAARHSKIDFVLEDGAEGSLHANRIFELGKASLLPEWSNFFGSLTFAGKTTFPGLQAADLLVYSVNREWERHDHGKQPTDIETLSHVAVGSVPQKNFYYHRMPITREILQTLRNDLDLPESDRKSLQGK